jgi:hypothetical protein
MGQGDVPTSRGGFFQRRREKRQLEQLAKTSEMEVTPRPSSTHIRVIEDQVVSGDQDLEREDTSSPIADPPPSRTGGFHVRPVPIDQPLGE